MEINVPSMMNGVAPVTDDEAGSSLASRLLRWSERASTKYAQVDFVDPTDLYNRPAPDLLVAFVVGAVLAAATFAYWLFWRWIPIRRQVRVEGRIVRTIISTVSDNDDPLFTILRLSSQSILFLGGFQLNFQLTFVILLMYYAVLSVGDSMRIFLSLQEANQLSDLVVVSKRDKRFLNVSLDKTGQGSAELTPNNVYEDLSDNWVIVSMVFITQVLLICFVCVDIYKSDTMSTLDGSSNAPIVGTLGSWLVYILGIFMQCVYILGPNTSFGTSEQNPHFWLQMMLSAKHAGCKCKWYDAWKDEDCEIDLHPRSRVIWIRFIMSFIINGVGFHILVHALPIQVAGQSSMTGIVFRAVGMMYLVDLDDNAGTTLKLVENDENTVASSNVDSNGDVTHNDGDDYAGNDMVQYSPTDGTTEIGPTGSADPDLQAHEAFTDARKKAEELTRELEKKIAEIEQMRDKGSSDAVKV